MEGELYAATFRPRDARDRLSKYTHGVVRALGAGIVEECQHRHVSSSAAYECAEIMLARLQPVMSE